VPRPTSSTTKVPSASAAVRASSPAPTGAAGSAGGGVVLETISGVAVGMVLRSSAGCRIATLAAGPVHDLDVDRPPKSLDVK
jgi:hypothetical protein